MNKALLLLSALLACVNFSACQDDKKQTLPDENSTLLLTTPTPLDTSNPVIQDPALGIVAGAENQCTARTPVNSFEANSSTPQAHVSFADEPEIEISFPDITKNLVAIGTLTIINKSELPITNIAIEGLPTKKVEVWDKRLKKKVMKSIFEYANAKNNDEGTFPGAIGGASCPYNGILERDFCEISLKAAPNNHLSTRTDSVTLTYTFRGQNYTKKVELSSTIVDRKELYVANPLFKTNGVNKEAKLDFPWSITNLSNLHEVTNVVITPPHDSVFTIDKTKVDNIKPKSPALVMELKYTPAFAGPELSETWDISYDIGAGADLEHRTLQFLVNAKATTSPGALEITGYDFGKKTIVDKGEVAIRLNLQNPGIGNDVADLTLLPDGAQWNAEPELELLGASTCVVDPNLPKGNDCYYDIVFKPGATNTAYARKFVLTYDKTKIIKFSIKGDITVLPPGYVIKQEFPEIIKAENKVSDPFFPYIKRPLKIDATTLYSKEILDRIPNETRHKNRTPFVPWSFKKPWENYNNLGKDTELGRIVPDRIKDKTGQDYEENGIKYVKLYHGSAAKYKKAFLDGGIAFDKGVRNAYGQGFYLTADINEAKRYACDAASLAGTDAILLVVGVQDIPEIKGNRSSNYQSSYTTGDPNNKNVYFGIGHTNQFVFFSNASKYMKMFSLVELPSKFGAAQNIIEEYDGYSTAESEPDNDPNGIFRCRN